MREDEVVYSVVKYARGDEKADQSVSHTKNSAVETQKSSTDSPGPRSKVTADRAAKLVLIVLLMAAVVGLSLSLITNSSTKKSLESLRIESERQINNLTETLSRLKLSSSVTSACSQPTALDRECKHCECGWKTEAEKCYFFSAHKLNWSASRRWCQSQGGDLVKIQSRDEQKFLEKTLRTEMEEHEDKFWIGLTDSVTENWWLWADDSPLDQRLTFWSDAEPDNWTGNNGDQADGEDCVRMGEKQGADDLKCWFDRSCKEPHKFICQKAATPGVSQRVCFPKPAASDTQCCVASPCH